MVRWLQGIVPVIFFVVAACGSTAAETSSEEELNGGCGIERWTVKVGTDAQAKNVNIRNV